MVAELGSLITGAKAMSQDLRKVGGCRCLSGQAVSCQAAPHRPHPQPRAELPPRENEMQ